MTTIQKFNEPCYYKKMQKKYEIKTKRGLNSRDLRKTPRDQS